MLKAEGKILDLRRIHPQGEEMTGEVETQSMHRLKEIFVALPASVQVNLFWQPRSGIVQVDGEIHMAAESACQRCLGTMPILIVAKVHAGVSDSEDLIERLDPGLEPVLSQEGRLNLAAWMEEELIISAPIAPACDIWTGGTCPLSQIDPGL